MSEKKSAETKSESSESKKDELERTLEEYLFKRRITQFWLPAPIIRKGKKKPSRIVETKKPKVKKVGRYIIKPGNWYAHIPIVVEECTK